MTTKTIEAAVEAMMVADLLLKAANKMRALGFTKEEIELVERYAIAVAAAPLPLKT